MPKTALLVIDVQVTLIDGAWKGEEVLSNIAELLRRAREAAAPVIFLQHNDDRHTPLSKGAHGWELHPAIAPHAGETVIDKTASDSFANTNLQQKLERLGATRVVITGLQTEFCVDATARAALSRGFEVVLAADAHTTGDGILPAETIIRHHNHTLAHLAHPQHAIAVIESAEISFA